MVTVIDLNDPRNWRAQGNHGLWGGPDYYVGRGAMPEVVAEPLVWIVTWKDDLATRKRGTRIVYRVPHAAPKHAKVFVVDTPWCYTPTTPVDDTFDEWQNCPTGHYPLKVVSRPVRQRNMQPGPFFESFNTPKTYGHTEAVNVARP